MSWGPGNMNMMCDIMPTISEDQPTQPMQEMETSSDGNADARLEQLMVNMLEERDRLQQDLDHTRRQLDDTQLHMRDIEKERESLRRQLDMQIQALPQGKKGERIDMYIGMPTEIGPTSLSPNTS